MSLHDIRPGDEIAAGPLDQNFKYLDQRITSHEAEDVMEGDHPHGLRFNKVILRPAVANISIPNNIPTKIIWNLGSLDSSIFFNPSEPTKLKIPSGINQVRIMARINWDSNDSGYRGIFIKRNDSLNYNAPPIAIVRPVSGEQTVMEVTSQVVPCSEGDEFEVEVVQTSGGSLDIVASSSVTRNRNIFVLEVVN